jgi:hypothetical protein
MAPRVNPILEVLSTRYKTLKARTARDARSPEVAELIAQFTSAALDFLSSCQRLRLISKVPEKSYFSFAKVGRKPKLSRAVNESLFDADSAKRYLDNLLQGTLSKIQSQERT